MSETPREYHVPFEVANEINRQATRARSLLENLAAAFAANDLARPPEERDIVGFEHVHLAADKLYGPSSETLAGEPLAGRPVFVSYAARDGLFARRFAEKLKANGIPIFFAAESIQPAAIWMESIWQALRDCGFVLFLATPAALRSDWCILEIGFAFALKKQIVPALRGVKPKELPDFLRRVQAVKVETAEQRRRLIKLLKKRCFE